MKQRTLHYLLIPVLIGIGMAGCRSDVNLTDVSVDSKLNARVSMPIGEMTATFGEMIGLIGFGDNAKISINSDSVLVLSIDEHFDNEFHAIELTDYTGTVESDKPVSEVMPGATMIPARTKETVTFDMNIRFDGINDDISDERIDSMVIDRASFTTKVTNNFGLTIADIDSVVMVLGPQFRRAKGTRQELPGFDFNKNIKIELDNFTLVMMKDESKAPADDNVINHATIQFVVYLNYKPEGNNNPFDPGFEYLPLTPTSAFHFSFQVEMMEYSALFGYFEPGSETHDINTIDVPITVPGNEPIILAAKEPKIGLDFTYGMAMPLQVRVNDVKAIHPDGTETLATWGGAESTVKQLNAVIPIDAPLDSTIMDSSIILTKESQEGHIDRFFLKEVKKLGYNYKLEVDRYREVKMKDGQWKKMDQFRMTHNTKFSMDFHFKMPFKFNKELKLAYADTIHDVNLQRASLDSLASMVPGGYIKSIDSVSLYVYLLITNEIPVGMKLDVSFIDENNQELAIDGLKDLDIEGATMAGLGNVTPADPIVYAVEVKTEDFSKLSKTQSIRISARLGDDQHEATFLTNKKLSIKAGVTGDVEAALNLSFDKIKQQ